MNLAAFPRKIFSSGPTNIEKLENLTKILKGPNIYIKRDDTFGNIVPGGNKTRKLEFLFGEAISLGKDTIITSGAIQSNHCRLTLAVANKAGFDCHLVLEERVPNTFDPKAGGNNFHYNLLGAKSITVVKGGEDLLDVMKKKATELESQGKKPYIIPTGGSSATGGLGYASCALELMQQSFLMNLKIDNIILTTGSGGTHGGLIAGMKALCANIPVTGVCISQKNESKLLNTAIETAKKMNTPLPTIDDIILHDDYIGEDYSIPTEGMIETVKLLAKTESVLLDPIYTGKAMHGMLDLYKKGYFSNCENILFIHTGGTVALDAFKHLFL